MNYFCCAENNAYNHWQLELLLASFKKLNLSDHLFLALYETKDLPTINFLNLIPNHKNKFYFQNEGSEHANELKSLHWLLKEGVLAGPITVVEPDFVILKPVEVASEQIVFHIDEEYYSVALCENTKTQFNRVSPEVDLWLPIGSARIINVDLPVIEKMIGWGMYLGDYRAAWSFAAVELNLETRGCFLENTMQDFVVDRPFIHYNHGLPPVFNKRMFICSDKAPYTEGKSPYRKLYEHTPTPAALRISQIAFDLLGL